MAEFVFLIVVILIFVVLRLYIRLGDAEARVGELSKRLASLETDDRRNRLGAFPAEKQEPRLPAPVRAVSSPSPPVPATVREDFTPPPIPSPARHPAPAPPTAANQTIPPAAAPAAKILPVPEKPLLPEFKLEAFMGVKMFAWLGGLALFIGVIFLIRYSFEHNLITPAMRIAFGALTGLGLIAGGWFMPRPKFEVTGQSLCSTGVVVLYGVIYSAHVLYGFIGQIPAFGAMAAITAGAFFLAVQLNAQVVAILGLLAGFLTPILLSTGEDHPVGLFTYLAVLDAGLMAVALRQKWRHLITLAAGATVLMQIGWMVKFFAPAKLGTAAVIFLGFEALFLLPFWLCNRNGKGDTWTASAAGLMAASVAGFAADLLTWQELGETPWPIFSILTLAVAGFVAMALRQRWHLLVTFAAGATALIEISWAVAFFQPAKVGIATIIFLGFEALFLLPFWRCNSDEQGEGHTTGAAGIMAAAGLGYAASLLGWPELGEKPWIVLSILMLADVCLVAWPLRRTALHPMPMLGGCFVFLTLGAWNIRYLSDALLGWALGFFLLFAAFHTVLPIVLRRLRPTAATPRWAQIFPALGLILMLWPALKIGASTTLWGAVLVVDLAAIALAAFTASLLGVVAALVLTLIAVGLWLAQTPVDHPSTAGLLGVIAGFAALFCGASVFLQRRLAASGLATSAAVNEREALQHLPAISAVLPFLLLIAAVERLHPVSPSPIFGVALFLVVMILALARWSDTLALPPVALGCGVALEYFWHVDAHDHLGGVPLAWYLGFAAIIAAFPFLFQPRASLRVTPWATAALAPVLHYPLVRDAAAATWAAFGQSTPGLIPAAFALPALAACDYLRRVFPKENPARLAVLAWFGGTALFFITLIFPAQFHREWLTISWALEGAALCWLFHRLPHPGLRLVGVALLVTAFVRLALNPAVLSYHARSGVPIWNWYLYTYGLATAAAFAGGFLLKPPRDRVGEINVCAMLFGLGTVLLFLLLNIQIADFFATGDTLTFDFSGNLARDMSYSIGWAIFALGLLLAGMHRQLAPVRYAGLGLFVVTLLKLFLHDLAQLDQLYRIGAFIAVAILLIGASYLYQRFLAVDEKKDENPPAPSP